MATKNLNIAKLTTLVADYCTTGDKLDSIVDDIRPLVAAIKSKSELRETILPLVAAHYGLGTKDGKRGLTFDAKEGEKPYENAKKRLASLLASLLGTEAKAKVEIEFEEKDVKAMQALLKRLETYAEYEVDGKKVGHAKALALLVAEAKDRI